MTRSALAAVAALALAAASAFANEPNPFAAAATPAPGAARTIGSHANGCVQGAVAIPLDGPAWHVLRPERNRNWGHPKLVNAMLDIARRFHAETGQRFLIADLGQPRGGPATGHASHQAGLDGDVRFNFWPARPLDPALRAAPPEVSMINAKQDEMERARWGADQIAALRIAAQHPDVDRIFVNPVIKRELCRAVTGDRAWLRKVVPWYGHHYHFHIRVGCPADSPACAAQAPVPPGDGCGAALAWWFTTEPFKSRGPASRPVPPAACLALVR